MCGPQLQRRCFCQAGTDRFCRETHSRERGRNSKIQLAAGPECPCPHISNELQRCVQAPRTSAAIPPCRAGTTDPLSCSALSLAHNGAEQSSPTVFHSSTSLSLQRQEALLGFAQQSLLQCRTGLLPPATSGTSFSSWDTKLCQKGRVSAPLPWGHRKATAAQQTWGDSEPSVHPSML